MSKTRWTKEQEEAIYKTGTNLLVSAGAGSGKTAVLTERIIEKLKSGIKIQDLLVLTFTNAAAFEMKERVRKKIKEEINKGYKELEEQLNHLDSAPICTFDSFSLDFLKKYHYLLGLDARINICDNIVLIDQKKKILNQVFISFYEKQAPSFLTFIDTFSIKDDQKLQNYIYNISMKLDHLYNKEFYLDTYFETYYSEETMQSDIKTYEKILEEHRDTIFYALACIEEKISGDIFIEWYEKLRDALSPLEKGNSYDTFRKSIFIKVPSLIRSKKIEEEDVLEISEDYLQIKENVDFLKKHCTYENREAIVGEIIETKQTVEVILSILKTYEKEMMEFKRKYGMYEFSDIARFSISILKNNPDICKQYQSKIQEIMIDEYQDTNDIGEYFISLLANDNVYMVGDVKQSIYGFRNANPSLFMDKYEEYKKEIGGYKIDLVSNFRSRREVIEAINIIFLKIMDSKMGGASYQEGHQMVFGNKKYESIQMEEQNNQMEILDYHYEKGSFTKEEIEAFVVARDIIHKKETHYQVMDGQTGLVRDIMYKDFTILMDRKTSFDLYKKIFTYLGIPLTIHKDETFVGSSEIYAIRSILKLLFCIQNHTYNGSTFSHAFLSATRSFLFSYTDEEIFDLFQKAKEENKTLYKSMVKTPFEPLYEKLLFLLQKLDKLSIRSLLEEIYITFDVYMRISTTQDVELGVAKLSYLLETASTLQEMGYGVEEFISYLDSSLKNKIDASFSAPTKKEDAVSIMTIHKSKGLEFPVCYYTGLYKKFSVEDFKDKFLLSNTYGIVVPTFKEGIKETIYKELVKQEYQRKDVSEKIRLLYVALTRAKEKIILVTTLRDMEDIMEEEKIPFHKKMTYQSFYDMLASIRKTLSPYIRRVEEKDLSITNEYLKNNKPNTLEKIPFSIEKITCKQINLPKKEREEKRFSGFVSLSTEEDKKQMEIGIMLHEYLELIDFQNREFEYTKYNIPDFYKQKIEKLFDVSFMKKVEGATIYKEYEFITEKDGVQSHGMIDLLIETEDAFYVIDYKLKEIYKESYEEQVKGYKEYIKSKTSKRVEGYLYSLLDSIYKVV